MRRLPALLLVLIFIVAAPASAGAASPKIVGGHFAAEGAYPFMVALVFKDAVPREQGLFCGGELIGPDTVLTASHCLIGFSPNDFQVLVGTNRLSTGGTVKDVQGTAVLPTANIDTLVDDVGIIKLTSPVAPAQTPLPIVDPAANASDAQAVQPGRPVKVIGWGALHDSGENFPDRLMETDDLRIVSDDDCETAYGALGLGGFDWPSTLCANFPPNNAEDACQGDSGGPLFASINGTKKLVGVVSSGQGCAQPGFPGTYAEIAKPALRSFATGYRDHTLTQLAPWTDTLPNVVAGPEGARPGGTLTCLPGTWHNDAAPTFSFVWGTVGSNPDTGQPTFTSFSDETDSTFQIADSDSGSRIACVVTGRNGAGSTDAMSTVAEIAGSPPTGPVDDKAPRTRLLARTCKGSTCKLLVHVTDPSPSAGIRSVTGTVTWHVRIPCKKAADRASGKRCFATRRSTAKGKRVSSGVYSIRLKKLPHGKRRAVVRVTDKAHHRAKALTVPLSV